MMLAHDNLRVVHVSTHVSLSQACSLVKKDRVLDVIRIANQACKDLGIKTPKIGVAGLNPHCGENGMFGTEEIEEIQPAIDAAMEEGICIPEKKADSAGYSVFQSSRWMVRHCSCHVPRSGAHPAERSKGLFIIRN